MWWRQDKTAKCRGVGFVRAVLALTLVSGLAAPVVGAQERPGGSDPFPLVATPQLFTDVRDSATAVADANWVRVDPDLGGTGRLVAVASRRIYLLDLATLTQRGVPGTASAETGVIELGFPALHVALDPIGHRAFLVEGKGPQTAIGQAADSLAGATIRTVSLDSSEAPSSYTFTEAEFAGHVITDLAYDPRRGVLYVLTVGGLVTDGASSGVTLHAIRGTAKLWSHRVQDCGTPVGNANLPALGFAADFVFFMCRGASPSGPSNSALRYYQYTQHGVVRVNLSAGGGQPEPGSDEFYPFGGSMTFGQASVDPLGGRIFVVPSGAGLRLYVFDVIRRAWTGSVPMKSEANPKGITVDPATGRIYSFQSPAGDDPNLIVTDATGVPVPQGDALSLPVGSSLPAFDPSRRLLFIPRASIDGTTVPLAVYLDRTPLPEEPVPAHPDAGTHDIDEEEAVQVTHTGAASAYGARVVLVGGVTGNAAAGPFNDNQQREQLKFDNGDRGLYLARAGDDESPGASLSGDAGSGTATAVAAAVTIDEVTADEFATRFGEVGQNPYATLRENVEESQAANCADFGDGSSSDTNASSRASCAERKRASSSVSAPRSPDVLPVKVAAASSTVNVTKDGDRGVVSTAEAVAQDIAFDVPGLGGVRIGAVRTIAESAAHGRPGTAGSTFRTVYEQVRIADAAGRVVFSCGFFGGGSKDEDEPCDAADVTTVINRRFRAKVQAFGPQPETDPLETGSPGGAQALVREGLYRYWNDFNVLADARREVPGLQLVWYDDSAQSSRLLFQFAAVSIQAGYEIGEPFVETPTEPASLSLELLDDLGQPLAGGVFEVREDASGGPGECPSDSADSEESTTTTVADDESTTTTVADEQQDDESDDGTLDGCGADEDLDDGDTESTTTTSTSSTTSTTVTDEGSTTTTTAAGSGSTTTTTAADDTEDGGLVDELTDELITDGTCVTGDDGIGDCVFEDLAPGSYIVTQKVAPAGYAPADDFSVMLTPGFASTVSFTNVKALATIEISLTDDADPPQPLPGGEFVVSADDGDGLLGDADVELGRCTTGADGTCDPFADVPLGAYVVHQSVAPNGLMAADDVAFTFDLPGQVAALAFVNGAPAIEAPLESAPPAIAGGSAEVAFTPPPSSGRVTMIPPPPLPPPVVTSVPIEPDRPSGLGRVMALPAQTASFIARSPGEALLFAGIWSLLLAPAYLAARRRKLTFLKVGI